MYQAKEKVIDNHKVVVTQWPARKALSTKLKLIRIIGPGLGEIASGLKGQSLSNQSPKGIIDSEMNLEKLSPAIEKLLSALNEETFMSLVTTLMSATRVDDLEMSIELNFDATFSGNLATFYKVALFVLEVNFGSFFGENGIGLLKAKAVSLMQSGPMSNNTSPLK